MKSKAKTQKQPEVELPDGVNTVTENGRTYYVYPSTGFKTPHLNRMQRHVKNRQSAPLPASTADGLVVNPKPTEPKGD